MTTHTLPIVGAHFRPPAKALLQVLPAGAVLSLVREPHNAYDENACAVFVEPKEILPDSYEELREAISGYGLSLEEIHEQPAWHLGYLPAKDMVGLAQPLDEALHVNSRDSWPAKLTFTLEGKPAASFELVLSSESHAHDETGRLGQD